MCAYVRVCVCVCARVVWCVCVCDCLCVCVCGWGGGFAFGAEEARVLRAVGTFASVGCRVASWRFKVVA